MNVRDELVSEIQKYLMGPREEDEILPDVPNYPIDYYTLGILFPQGAEPDALDSDDFEGDVEDRESPDSRDLVSPQIKQGAIGLRVDIADGVKKINVEIGYAKYDNIGTGWKRLPLRDNNHHVIDLGYSSGKVEILGDDGIQDALLSWVFDEGNTSHGNHRVLNLFLENSRKWKVYDKDKDDFNEVRKENNNNAMFQPFIKIYSNGKTFRFYKSKDKEQIQIAEDQSLDLVFRNTVIFGEGFNCAAVWDKNSDPLWVCTEFIPRYVSSSIGKESEGGDDKSASVDLLPLSFAEQDDDKIYKKQFEENVRPIIDGYTRWINVEKTKLKFLESGDRSHVPAAKNSIYQCEEACRRMEKGLKFLLADGNEKVRLSFALANRAMLHHRIRSERYSKIVRGESPGPKPDPKNPDKSVRWYPFQIAFFVMNIHSIADRVSPEREIVDLLWFPTGGGKTEAYLAVAAFTMIYRRLKGNNDGLGTAVIMRYTLRLLTLQQLERASTLMCALEFLRLNNPEYGLGDSPFLIGLWVGVKLTPNRYKESEDNIKEQRNRREMHISGSSPMQLIRCPWCGAPMNPYCYEVSEYNQWTVIHCSSKDCFFFSNNRSDTKRALPVITVDTDIYRRCPSMIVATVDKFARMPYRSEIASIFGRVDRYCDKHGFLTAGASCGASRHRDAVIKRIEQLDGPDLIIQDELHLITGALGSMVGLYETAVDYLSQRRIGEDRILPKIIGSTATIRGADSQIRKLFNRSSTHKFPPPGIDKNDSFFWWESDKPGREYVGVSFSHRSAKYTLAKIYASLLQKVKTMSTGLNLDEIDPYWTLVGYFNSIRELGGTIRLVEDDVTSNIRFITSTIFESPESEMRDPGRPHNGMEELTGRITQSGIRDIREKLEKRLDEQDCISTLLATNMISVGIDIERLGMMVVNGQTKNSSEYIQATGRIGRRPQIPGLVFTLYNPYKPRDLSHYENFTGHHSMLQKNVEPSTLTPFSVGALERGIHAVLIAMIRLSIPNLADRKSADNFERENAEEAITFILERYLEVQQVHINDDGYKYAKTYLESFVDNWVKIIQKARDDENGVWYHNTYKKTQFSEVDDNQYVLMEDFSKYSGSNSVKATPESLRDVERSVRLSYR